MQKCIGEIIYLKFQNGWINKYKIIEKTFSYRTDKTLYLLRREEHEKERETFQLFEDEIEKAQTTLEEYLALAGNMLTDSINEHKLWMQKIDALTDCF